MTKTGLLTAVALATSLFGATPSASADEDLTFDQLPPPVQVTVKREVKGGRIVEIERDYKRGQPVFEIEFIDENVKWEIHVAPDGTLLMRRED